MIYVQAATTLTLTGSVAIESMPSSIAEMRALQWASLSDGAKRAAQVGDLRAEVAFRRLAAQVSGTTRAEVEDSMASFIRTVQRIAGAPQDKPVLGPAKRERPTAPQRGSDASEATDPEFHADADALEQFDREN